MKRLFLLPLFLAGLFWASTASAQVEISVANEGVTGTTLNKLAKLTGAPSSVLVTAISDTGGAIGIVTGNAGTSGNARVARAGIASCVFDAATTAGDYVQISSSVAGDCHDAGATYPTTGQVLGRILSTNGAGGTYAMTIAGTEVQAAASASSLVEFSTGAGSLSATNVYIGTLASTAATNVRAVTVHRAGTLSGLICNFSAAAGLGNTFTFTLAVNGSDNTNQQASITGASQTKTTTVTNVGVAVSAGDLLAIHMTISGGTPAAAGTCALGLL